MTANKRFTVHIRWFNYEKTEGEIELKDNGQPLLLSESVEDVQYIKTLLNELSEENNDLKKENKKLKCINKQVEDRLENSGIGIALDMRECE